MKDLAEALLSAHVEHELSRLRGDALAGFVNEHLARGFAWLEDVKFNDVVTREQIVGVIDRYVIELKVSGGITELAGEMASVVFSSRSSLSTRIGEVLQPESYEEFADKIVTLERVHRELIRYVTQSAAFGTLSSRVLSRAAVDLVFQRSDAAQGSRLGELVRTVGKKVLPGLERRLGAVLSRYIEEHAARFTRDGEQHLLRAVDREWVRQMADEIWDAISGKPLAEAGTVFSPQDLEDFVVLGYEFWLRFRKTPYFHAIVAEVVGHLFSKYGEESLASVIADMGITQHMVAQELVTFLGPVLEHGRRTGFLEQELHALLEPFYRSPGCAEILAGRPSASRGP